MSEKPKIADVAATYFHLWQQQVTLMAQTDEAGLQALIEQGRQIGEHLSLEAAARCAESEADADD
ncbi:hypothetical protein GCM10007924_05160 [Sneathiella chinensis]|uniref:Uncharacterized protein n=2 Tax=Sneathiella chinensis TaxID=349750 RepID=A0ABQ5TZL6_9PROT|nr:hypothetical protein GCM10007924_05160 [Sneathiella chinensis]